MRGSLILIQILLCYWLSIYYQFVIFTECNTVFYNHSTFGAVLSMVKLEKHHLKLASKVMCYISLFQRLEICRYGVLPLIIGYECIDVLVSTNNTISITVIEKSR